MQRTLIMDLLMEVANELTIKISRKKLLWMLGYKYDKPSAWAELLDIWIELGFDEDCLQGFSERDSIVLLSVTGSIEKISTWRQNEHN